MSPAASLKVAGAPRDALALGTLRALEGEPLARFLSAQRWFGGKGQANLSPRFRDVIPLFTEEMDAVLARIDVPAHEGAVTTYQLPILAKLGGVDPADPTLLARIETSAGAGTLVDAAGDEAFRARLLRALHGGEQWESGGLRWIAERTSDDLPAPETPSRVLGGEQSNTSILYGERAMAKLYRRLAAGPNPEVEISEFLTRRGFPNIPALLGLIRIRDAGGTETAAGVFQEFVAAIGDGWTYARRRIRELMIATDAAPAGRAAFLADCRRLGEVTGGLHRELAADATSEAFAPEPVTPEDLARWATDLRRQVDRSLGLLESSLASGRVEGPVAAEARAVLAQARPLGERASAFLAGIQWTRGAAGAAGAKIRHHGDYHLGQVLRRPSGDFVILDFEGEPARPLAERRRRHSPLRDVAGMLRSFAYAVAATLKDEPPGSSLADCRSEAAVLSAAMRTVYLEAYFAAGPQAPILPADAASRAGLLAVFEIEKVFYELAYELDNRPHWVDIPLGAVRALVGERMRDGADAHA